MQGTLDLLEVGVYHQYLETLKKARAMGAARNMF
jgi:hypothetical protein